jgi:hypothetical protein
MLTTIEIIQTNSKRFSSQTPQDWEKQTVTELRNKVRACGITNVLRDGELVKLSCSKKTELIDTLITITQPFRENPFVVEEKIEMPTAKKIFDSLLSIAKNSVSMGDDARQVAVHTDNILTRIYCNSASTRAGKRSVLKSQIRGLMFNNNYQDINGLYDVHQTFERKFSELNNVDSNVKKEFTNFANSEKKPIEAEGLTDWAEVVLTDCNNWKNVAIALAYTTGRRMFAEVLIDGNHYTVTSDSTIMFTGQAKRHPSYLPEPSKVDSYESLDDEPYEFTTLVETSLVMNGFEYLLSLGKLTPVGDDILAARKKSHTRHSRYLSEQIKRMTKLIRVGRIEDLTVKTLRSLYSSELVKDIGDSDERLRIVGTNLGHRDGGKRLVIPATADSYIK